MLEYLGAFYEGSTEISPDELIGALMIGLALAMACSGLCLLSRKRASNAFPVFCGLIFAVSAISMIVGIGHARFKFLGPGRQKASALASHQLRPPFHWSTPPPGSTPPRRRIGRI